MVDVVVIGAGAGGLGAALGVAEAGRSVRVLESLTYPGGCASTYTRQGATFESGATLLTGLAPGEVLRNLLDRWAVPVDVRLADRAMTVRTPDLELPVWADRARFADALDGTPPVRAFLETQRRAADALWSLLSDPSLLPPLSVGSLLRHAVRAPRLLPVAGRVGGSLERVLHRHGVAAHPRLRTWADALCQITVQVPAASAEAPFALGALDFPFRGPGHVAGGMGGLADGLVAALRRLGGEVSFADRVRALRRDGEGWVVVSRSGEHRARRVIANLAPAALERLIGETPRLRGLDARVQSGWGAAMLYLQLDPIGLPDDAVHLQLWADPSQPPTDGNLVLVSVPGERRAPGRRTATVSTHLTPGASPSRVAEVQDRMRATVAAFAPELRVCDGWTASPRTFARFTGRPDGFVGGVPRRIGLGSYRDLWPQRAARGLWLVGDSVGLGQSVPSALVTGARTAVAALRG